MTPSMGAADTDALPDVETPTAEGAPGGHAHSHPRIRVQDDSHDKPQTLQPPNLSDDEHFLPRQLTSRPSFLEKMANSRETQFTLHRRQSTDVDRYFVCFFAIAAWYTTRKTNADGWWILAWPPGPG